MTKKDKPIKMRYVPNSTPPSTPEKKKKHTARKMTG